MEATSAPPILLSGIGNLPCLQEIRSVKDKPFYCQSSVGTIPFQGRVFLLLPFCNHMATIPCLLTEKNLVSHTALRDEVLLEAGDVVVTNNANATSSLSQPASLSDFPTEACFICGSHQRTQDLVVLCCVRACASCAQDRFRGTDLTCPICER